MTRLRLIEKLKRLRKEKGAAREASGKTQAQVAKEVGIREQAYQRYEYDACEPGVRTAIRIAAALDTTVEKIFGD